MCDVFFFQSSLSRAIYPHKLNITIFSEQWPTWEVFFFSLFLNLASSTSTSASRDDCIGTQRGQRQGRCCRASGRTAQRERAAEGAARAVGARTGLRRHCRWWVDNVTRANNEQRMAGGCSDDSGGNVVAWTAGGGRCDKTRRIRQ